MIVKAWGVLSQSPLVVSSALKSLNVSHSILTFEKRIPVDFRVDGLCAQQPAWPVLVDSLEKVAKVQSTIPDVPKILYVFDSRAALMHTNLKPLQLDNIIPDVQQSLKLDDLIEFKLERREPSLLDFIDMATKPSILRTLQTAWCKINPYAFRKEVQEAIITYIYGSRSFKATKNVLARNLRAEAILPTLKSNECETLVSAVRQTRAGLNVDHVCDALNIEAFDVNYIIMSGKKYNAH